MTFEVLSSIIRWVTLRGPWPKNEDTHKELDMNDSVYDDPLWCDTEPYDGLKDDFPNYAAVRDARRNPRNLQPLLLEERIESSYGLL